MPYRPHKFSAPLRTLLAIIRRLASLLYTFCTALPTNLLKAPRTTGVPREDIHVIGEALKWVFLAGLVPCFCLAGVCGVYAVVYLVKSLGGGE